MDKVISTQTRRVLFFYFGGRCSCDMANLTTKQEKYVQGLISGLSQREAYKQAGYSVNGKTDEYIDIRASEMMKNSKVLVRYQELLEEHKSKALWTREQAVNDLIWLKTMAKNDIIASGLKKANSDAMLASIKELNALEDLYPKDSENEQTDEAEEWVKAMGEVDE